MTDTGATRHPAGSAPASSPNQSSTLRVLSAGMIGTVVEYFDFLIYATISGLIFGQLFFPNDNEFVGTLLAWGTFAVSYLARPFGGILFGHFGDRLGRSRVLFITLIMMGVSTTVIGLLPTYDQIGIAAPIILVFLRIVQGIGVGGEYGGATLMVIEHTHGSGRRGLWGALVTASSSMGFLLASALMAVLTAVTTDAQFSGGAWRIPFLISSVLLIIGFYIRYRLGETPVMADAIKGQKTVQVPLLELFRTSPRRLLAAVGAPFGMFATYYVMLVFAIPYVVSERGTDQSFLLTMSTIAQVVYVAAVIFGGYVSDRWGRRAPMMWGAAGLGAWGFAFFPLLLTGSGPGTLVGLGVGLALLGLIVGPLAAFLAELFGTGVRFSGLSFGYQISAAMAGGLSPVIASILVHQTGSWVPVAAWSAFALSMTFLAVFLSAERANADLTMTPEDLALSTPGR